MSLRGADWVMFAYEVVKHINLYTVPQYGDKGSDEADDFTPEECVKHIKRYAARFGKSQREGQDLLDLLKIAHYAQLAYTKIQESDDAKE
jgi:hypothetical protein